MTDSIKPAGERGYEDSQAEVERLRDVLRRIAGRRPAHEDAAAAFYRCRQDAREALR